jgi:hypothetical protein
MPVHVNEVIIRATVTEPGNAAGAQSGGGAPVPTDGKEEMITECVEQVLEIIRRELKR